MQDKKRYILDKITEIRKNKADFYMSNVFKVPDSIVDFYEDENGIAFLINDKDVYRAYFACNKASSLQKLLSKMPTHTGVEIIGKSLDSITKEALEKSGYSNFTTYLRACNTNLKETFDKNIPDKFKNVDYRAYVQNATLKEMEQIYELLYGTFTPLTSHLQNEEELKEDIKNNKVRISIEDTKVIAILTYDQKGKKLYMEHAINQGRSILMHSLYFSVLEDAVIDGVNFVYTWMREDNDRVLAFAKRYGIVPDGIKNYVYIKDEN